MTPRSNTPRHSIWDDRAESAPPSSSLRRTGEELSRHRKLDDLGRHAGGALHDINNLLAIILGQSELIQKQLPESHPIVSQVDAIQWAAERAAALIRRSFAAIRDPGPSCIADLASVLRPLQPMLRAVLGERISLDVRCDGALGRIPIDPGRIEQILLNLVANARDAMPEGGHLSILMHDLALRDGHSRWVVLEVTDSGVGIETSALERIFEPLFTTKEIGKGTGLGLWMVRELVSGCGGEISVRSTPGLGTTFEIRFPRLADEPA